MNDWTNEEKTDRINQSINEERKDWTNQRLMNVVSKTCLVCVTGNRDPEHCGAEREDGSGASEGGDGGHRRDGYRRVRRCAVPVHWWRCG